MAQKKPPQPPLPDDLPPVFADLFSDEAGGSAPSRIEVYRVSPNGGALIGEPAYDSTAADLVDFVRTEDKTYGRRGGVYDARLKNAAGQYVKRHRFRVDRDPELADASSSAAAATTGLDPTFGAIGGLVTMMEAQARSYEQRVRADMAAREQQARLDAERREREWQAQQQRERAYYDQQRERDRELSDQARERDRGMFSFLLEAGKRNGGGDGKDVLQTFLAGLALAQEMGTGGEGGPSKNFGDAILEKLGGKVISRLAGGDEDDARAQQAKPADAAPAAAAAPTKKGRRRKPEPEPEDDEDDGNQVIDMIETLLLNVDAKTAAAVMQSLVENGKLTRQILSELAEGKLDAMLGYEKDVLDKLHKAAETAYRATAPRPVKASQ